MLVPARFQFLRDIKSLPFLNPCCLEHDSLWQHIAQSIKQWFPLDLWTGGSVSPLPKPYFSCCHHYFPVPLRPPVLSHPCSFLPFSSFRNFLYLSNFYSLVLWLPCPFSPFRKKLQATRHWWVNEEVNICSFSWADRPKLLAFKAEGCYLILWPRMHEIFLWPAALEATMQSRTESGWCLKSHLLPYPWSQDHITCIEEGQTQGRAMISSALCST